MPCNCLTCPTGHKPEVASNLRPRLHDKLHAGYLFHSYTRAHLQCVVTKQTAQRMSHVPLLKDHLFIHSLEKEGQELLRGESAIAAVLAHSLTHTGAPLTPSERVRERKRARGEERGEEREPGEGQGAASWGLPPQRLQCREQSEKRSERNTITLHYKSWIQFHFCSISTHKSLD